MAQKEEVLTDAFEEEEVTVEEEPKVEKAEKEKKKAKPAELLTEDKCRKDKDGNSLYPKYLEYIDLLGGWDAMEEPDRKRINGTFKIPGRAFGGTVDTSTLPPAHRKALDLIKQVSDAAYAGVENNAMDIFNELQAMNPKAKLSVEVYLKGKNKFVDGLPKEEE